MRFTYIASGKEFVAYHMIIYHEGRLAKGEHDACVRPEDGYRHDAQKPAAAVNCKHTEVKMTSIHVVFGVNG